MFRIDDGKSKEREPLFPKSERKMGGPMDFTRAHQEIEARLAEGKEEENKDADQARARRKQLPRF